MVQLSNFTHMIRYDHSDMHMICLNVTGVVEDGPLVLLLAFCPETGQILTSLAIILRKHKRAQSPTRELNYLEALMYMSFTQCLEDEKCSCSRQALLASQCRHMGLAACERSWVSSAWTCSPVVGNFSE
eukprot:3363405-Amphidinium_carterae.3